MPSDRPPRAKASKALNCAECRRVKVRCDRKTPCGRCVRIGHPELCPEQALRGVKDRLDDYQRLTDPIRYGSSSSANVVQSAPHEPLPSPSHAANPFDHHEQRNRPLGTSFTDPASLAFSPRPNAPDDHGTLVSNRDESFTFVGPSGAVQVLREDMFSISRPSTPPLNLSGHAAGPGSTQVVRDYSFALTSIPPRSQTLLADLHAALPALDRAQWLAQSYFRRAAWIGAPYTEKELSEVMERSYRLPGAASTSFLRLSSAQDMALIFAVLAIGTVVDMEQAPQSQLSNRYLDLAMASLTAGKLLTSPTLSGVAALCIVIKTVCYVDMFQRWDYAWQLCGMAQRLVISMGLHKDGQHWGLDPLIIERRRRLFWDVFVTDTMMSAFWDRPPAIAEGLFDTKMPLEWKFQDSFDAMHAHLATRIAQCLRETHLVGGMSWARVVALWKEMSQFEDHLPQHLRCPAAVKSMASKPLVEPMDDPHDDPVLILQQHYLAVKLCTAISALLRSHFVLALRSGPEDPSSSAFAAPFLAVVERSRMVLATLLSLYRLVPLVASRHWFFWSDGITAATCLCVTCIVSPQSPLTSPLLNDLADFMEILQSLRSSMPREEKRQDIDWLGRLYHAAARISQSAKTGNVGSPSVTDFSLQMLGWRTRLLRGHSDTARGASPSSAPPTDFNELDWDLLLQDTAGLPPTAQGANGMTLDGILENIGAMDGQDAQWWDQMLRESLHLDRA